MSNEGNTRILVIVDDPIVRESIAFYLSKQNYRTCQSSEPEEVIELFHSFVPDLVLCDIHFGNTEGFDTLEAILTVAPTQAIIVFADKDNTEGIVEVMKLGVSDYFFSPVDDMAILNLAVSSNLKRARILEENRTNRKELEVINQELETTLAIFEADQQAGRHVQVSMLPKPPQDIDGFHFDHRVIPSLYLSGDSVDYKPVTKHKVLFYIADVSGHGSSSAFVTTLLRFRIEQLRRKYIRKRFVDDFSPASILDSLNQDLIDANLDKHITLFVGLLSNENNSLQYSVAGHHPLPILFGKGKAQFIEVSKSSFPVGLIEQAEYFNESILLEQGFSLTLFSDGILETMQEDSMLEKEAQLLKVIEENRGEFNPIKAALGLNSITNVPDDIAVMSVSLS